MTQYINSDRNIIYTQPYGGSLGVGILLGPIGVAANVALIDSATKADVQKLFGKVQIDPKQSFSKAATSAGMDLIDASETRVTPFILITKVTESSINIGVGLMSEQAGRKPTKYMYQLQNSYTIEEFASLDKARQEDFYSNVDGAYGKLLSFYLKDAENSASVESKVEIKSSFISPRFVIPMPGTLAKSDDDVTWVRTLIGTYGLQSMNSSITRAN